MTKTHSAERVTQSYLARKPSASTLFAVQKNEEISGGWVIHETGHVITGTLGRKSNQVLSEPERLIEDFANTSSDPADILRFTRRYGVLHRNDVDWLDIPGDRLEGDRFCIHCGQWLESQARMRQEWERRGRTETALAQTLAREINPKSENGRSVKVFVRPDKRGFHLELQPDDLLGALWIAFLGFSDRARKCQNPKCSAPYFLASRRDQKFCGDNCSRLVANRRWWAKKGMQWREQRKARQSKLQEEPQ